MPVPGHVQHNVVDPGWHMVEQPRHTRGEGDVEPRILERRGLRGERGSDPFLVRVRHGAAEPLTVLAQQRDVGDQVDVRGHGTCSLDWILPPHSLRDPAVTLQGRAGPFGLRERFDARLADEPGHLLHQLRQE